MLDLSFWFPGNGPMKIQYFGDNISILTNGKEFNGLASCLVV